MNKTEIISEFKRIEKLGFIKSKRAHNTGIGKTFEELLGMNERNKFNPNFSDLEIKSKREFTHAYITLFTKSPTHPKRANTILRDVYGEPYSTCQTLKRINTSLFVGKYNNFCNRYGFMLVNNKTERRICINIKNLATNELIDDTMYWTYDDLKTCLTKKLKTLFFVSAESKIEDNHEFFHYNKAELYLNPCIDRLLNLLEDGKVMVDIRVGSYRSGVKEGKIHDHGTAFRMKLQDLSKLYEEVTTIE